MGKPLTFHFSYGAHDTPRVMVIVDLQATCQLCGYEEIQRFYKGVAFHSMGLASFERLVHGAPELLGYSCANCGSEVTPAMCQRGALTYGFPDGTGIIQASVECQEGRVTQARYRLQGQRRLDPQALPPFASGREQDEPEEASLHGEAIFATFQRAFSLKAVWRSLVAEHLDSGQTLFEQAAPGCWLAIGRDEDEIEAMLAEDPDPTLRELLDRGQVVLAPLLEPPEALPWLEDPARVHGNPRHWLQPEALVALAQRQCVAEVYLQRSFALEAMTEAMTRARLEFRVDESSGATFVTDITSPRGAVLEHGVSLEAVLALAAHTAITPGEAGRMAAEELIAEMMGIEL